MFVNNMALVVVRGFKFNSLDHLGEKKQYKNWKILYLWISRMSDTQSVNVDSDRSMIRVDTTTVETRQAETEGETNKFWMTDFRAMKVLEN